MTKPLNPGNPWEGHRGVRAFVRQGPYTVPIMACSACSQTQARAVPFPCPVVTVEPATDAEIDAELRELIGGT